MDRQIRDKFLTEAMGGVWHEVTWAWSPYSDDRGQGHNTCSCSGNAAVQAESHRNKSFSDWAGFGRLWNWSKTQEWWADFMSRDVDVVDFFESLIDPDNYADAIYELLAESV